jgi:hypothetical protein
MGKKLFREVLLCELSILADAQSYVEKITAVPYKRDFASGDARPVVYVF